MEKKEKLTLAGFMEEKAKGKPLNIWFNKAVGLIWKFRLATHIGKFKHPDSRITIFCKNRVPIPGYVTTSGSMVVTDIFTGSASSIGIADFLKFPLPTGEFVLNDVYANHGYVRKVCEDLGLPYTALEEAVNGLEERKSQIPDHTEPVLNQVFFPVSNDTFHLLTPVPCSSLLLSLKERILEDEEQRFNAVFNKKSIRYGTEYAAIPDLGRITFGGSQPQNVSLLNKNAREARLLIAMPPVWNTAPVRFPRRNFFRECMRFREIRNEALALGNLLIAREHADIPNSKFRPQKEKLLWEIIEKVQVKVMVIRESVGWTQEEKYNRLSLHQKLWLDPEEHGKVQEWVSQVAEDFASWILLVMNRLRKNSEPLTRYQKLSIQKDLEWMLKEGETD